MKILFRNVFSFLTIIVFTLSLTACGSNSGKGTKTIDCEANPDAAECNNGGTYDLGGATVRILHGAPQEIDPFHDHYSGDFQTEKQALQRAVEQKYNVKIKYQLFPDDAPWGPERVNAIIQGVLAKKPIGEIYAVSSMWIGELAEAKAIAPVKSYIRDFANGNYDPKMKSFGSYKDDIYGFDTGYVINDSSGIYFNLDLVEDLGLKSPAEKWNDGEWTWDDFTEYVNAAQAALSAKGEDYFAMGGVPAVWAQNMIPANGGYLINPDTMKVAFDQSAGLQTFNYLTKLNTSDVWEPAPEFDSGSGNWKLGKVLLHPGELWFVNADNRWGLLDFKLGYVPYPVGNGKTADDYKIGKDSMQLFAISSGYDKANNPNGLNDEVLFKIWNDLQKWQTYGEVKTNFEFTLEEKYNDQASIQAHLSVLDKIYIEQIFNLGISGHNPDVGFYTIGNKAIKEGDANAYLSAIKPVYQEKLDSLFGNE